ncbi:MAG: RDD family protein [Candidatus Thorarchaeota archaeon]
MFLKYCPKCGNKLEPNVELCNSCGADLKIRQSYVNITAASTTKSSQSPRISSDTLIYADILKRIIAFIIDSIIIGIVGSGLSWLIFTPWFPFYSVFNPLGTWWITFPFDWVIAFLYYWLLESRNKGQTLGKMALSIRTVDEKTLKPANSNNYAINNVLKGSPFLIVDLIIGLLKNSEDPKRRLRYMQNVSETVVIISK